MAMMKSSMHQTNQSKQVTSFAKQHSVSHTGLFDQAEPEIQNQNFASMANKLGGIKSDIEGAFKFEPLFNQTGPKAPLKENFAANLPE